MASLRNWEMKEEVIRNKSKLKEKEIYILTMIWKERRIQEKIGRWVQNEREKRERIQGKSRQSQD